MRTLHEESTPPSVVVCCDGALTPCPIGRRSAFDAASITQLDAWLNGIFDAHSLEGLIGGERN